MRTPKARYKELRFILRLCKLASSAFGNNMSAYKGVLEGRSSGRRRLVMPPVNRNRLQGYAAWLSTVWREKDATHHAVFLVCTALRWKAWHSPWRSSRVGL